MCSLPSPQEGPGEWAVAALEGRRQRLGSCDPTGFPCRSTPEKGRPLCRSLQLNEATVSTTGINSNSFFFLSIFFFFPSLKTTYSIYSLYSYRPFFFSTWDPFRDTHTHTCPCTDVRICGYTNSCHFWFDHQTGSGFPQYPQWWMPGPHHTFIYQTRN